MLACWSKIETYKMAELTRKDLKEVFTESLEPFAKAVQEDFRAVNTRLDKVDPRLDKMDSRFDGLEERMVSVEADVKWMKENASELFAKLDRFIALLEKNEQETLMLSAQMKRLEERVEKLESHRK